MGGEGTAEMSPKVRERDMAVARAGRCVVKRVAIMRPSGHAARPERKIVPMAWAVQVSRQCLYALRSLLRA